tara:strand:+ start:297 stop:1073 length:777 start_codon:yes stop_codon:yes gene_type:complete
MNRYALKIEYDGTLFHGWQKQQNLDTVQGSIELALKRLDPSSKGITGAGRTDAGVHATGQVAHLDLKKNWNPDQLKQALNFFLKPKLISIVAAAKVDMDFHARFSAVKRYYLYKIINRNAPLTLDINKSWQVRRVLDVEKMNQAAKCLVGTHDFTTFRSSSCQAKSPIKSIDKVKIDSVDSSIGKSIYFKFEARSFLHNQIRSIVGTLEKVGANRWPKNRVILALSAKNRNECGPVAPANGLYLTKIDYKEDIFRKIC